MLGQIHNQRRSAEFAGKSYSRAIAITKAYNEKMDFATEYGFAIVFLLLLRVKPGGLLFAGIQCSSWVWMNSATFQRTPENIWGNEATKGVEWQQFEPPHGHSGKGGIPDWSDVAR